MFEVLVVSMSSEWSGALVKLLKESGYSASSALGFAAATQALVDHSPDLLVSEVRLGAFNGLDLVIRCHSTDPAMRAILLDRTHDSVLEFEAEREGAAYLVDPVDDVELVTLVSRRLAELSRHRRWPRKQLAGSPLIVHVRHGPARVVDLSYGGLRVELPEPADLASEFDVRVLDLDVRVRPVWTGPTPSGWFWCGAELCDTDPQTLSVWRELVDSAQAA